MGAGTFPFRLERPTRRRGGGGGHAAGGVWALLWATALLSVPVLGAAATLSLEIEGLDEPLAQAARTRLTLAQHVGREVQPAQLRRLLSRSDTQIRQALEPFGYYEPQVTSDVQQEDDEYRVVFRVDPGEPVVVRQSRVEVSGPGGLEPEVRSALQNFEPRMGERFEHAAYEESKAQVSRKLRAAGYLGAETTRSRVEIVAGARAADIQLVWNSGEEYDFGPVRFTEAQFPESFLQDFVPWEPGEAYSFDALLELQERLVGTGYFSSVSVQPDLGGVRDGQVPVDVALVADEQTEYSAGVFLSTDVGPGVRLGMDRRWVNRKGHTFNGQMEYATNLRRVSATYRIPQPGGDRDLRFGGAYTDKETDTSISQNARVVAAETQRNWYGFTRSLGVQYLMGNFEVADENGSSSLLYADLSLSRERADDPINPRRGYSITLGLRAGPDAPLTDTGFAQLRAEGRWVQSVGEATRVLGHVALGAMTVGDFDELPPELRFFAGGDRSIRGFEFEEIGETNSTGGVIGGEYLAVGGIELEHYVLPAWGVAAFVDGGDAFRSSFDLNVGAGMGLRWRSPVGAVRLDFAKPVVTDFGDGWRIHLVIGSDF